MSDLYPEQRPQDTVPTAFLVSPSAAQAAAEDLGLQIQAVEAHVQRIIDSVEVRGVPILAHIANLTHDYDMLTDLSKKLARLAEYLPKLDQLQKRKAFVDFAATNPIEAAMTLGEVDDSELTRLYEGH